MTYSDLLKRDLNGRMNQYGSVLAASMVGSLGASYSTRGEFRGGAKEAHISSLGFCNPKKEGEKIFLSWKELCPTKKI